MAYRNGTYVTFHAGGTTDPTASDMKYYGVLQAWDASKTIDFEFINSHEKTAGVRDSSSRETLRRRLVERLNKSKNLLLILTMETKKDTDWVPFEIRYGADDCQLPFIVCYPDYQSIFKPAELSPYWPAALREKIENGSLKAIHIPFRKDPIFDAIGQFSVQSCSLTGPLGFYSEDAQRAWGLLG